MQTYEIRTEMVDAKLATIEAVGEREALEEFQRIARPVITDAVYGTYADSDRVYLRSGRRKFYAKPAPRRFDTEHEEKAIDLALAQLKQWLMDEAKLQFEVEGSDFVHHEPRDIAELVYDLGTRDPETFRLAVLG